MTTLTQIYDWFMTGKKPTQAQFWASWGSFWHKEEKIPQNSINNLESTLNAKTEKDQFNAHKTDDGAHADLFSSKVDKGGYDGSAQDLKNDIDGLNLELIVTDYLNTEQFSGDTLSFAEGFIFDGINNRIDYKPNWTSKIDLPLPEDVNAFIYRYRTKGDLVEIEITNLETTRSGNINLGQLPIVARGVGSNIVATIISDQGDVAKWWINASNGYHFIYAIKPNVRYGAVIQYSK